MENHVVSFSGGRTSAYMVYLFEQRRKTENINVNYVFCDTGAEHSGTYAFLRDVVDNWGIELTCLRTVVHEEMNKGCEYQIVSLDECSQDLKPFFEVSKKYSLPDLVNCHCTDRMKTLPFYKYCNDTYGRGNYTRWLGMRIDEPNRIKKSVFQKDLFDKQQKRDKELMGVKYLAEISNATKEDILDFWSKQPFDLQIEEHLGNCVFCIKKNPIKLTLAARQEPEMADKFIKMINHEDIRPKPNGLPHNVMYRGHNSLEGIIKGNEGISEETLIDHIKKGKRDTSECGESCEPTFPSSEFELEMQQDGRG